MIRHAAVPSLVCLALVCVAAGACGPSAEVNPKVPAGVADEINPGSEIYRGGYRRGMVAMANAGPNTNGSQFFILPERTSARYCVGTW